MGLKYHTVIFVPHARAQFRKWRVSNRQIIFLSTFLGLWTAAAFTTTGYLTYSYMVTEDARSNLEKMQGENRALRDANQSFEDTVRTLQRQLADYEDRTNALAIVAGLKDVASTEERERVRSSGSGGADLYDSVPISEHDLALIASRAENLDHRLGQVKEELDRRLESISATPAIMPAKGIFTSGFGYRRDPMTGHRAFHRGVDISAPPGKEIQATADGIVTRAGRVGGLGRAVTLAHGFGYTTRYGHLDKIVVSPGQRIARGDVVGLVGRTGRSTGYHLHYEVWVDGKATNPMIYILDRPKRR